MTSVTHIGIEAVRAVEPVIQVDEKTGSGIVIAAIVVPRPLREAAYGSVMVRSPDERQMAEKVATELARTKMVEILWEFRQAFPALARKQSPGEWYKNLIRYGDWWAYVLDRDIPDWNQEPNVLARGPLYD